MPSYVRFIKNIKNKTKKYTVKDMCEWLEYSCYEVIYYLIFILLLNTIILFYPITYYINNKIKNVRIY